MAESSKAPWLEWLASGIGLALAASMLAYLAWQGVRGDDAAPAVSVEAARVVETAAGYTVEIVATNRSGATAAQVRVQGTLRREGTAVETAEAVFDYLPGRSRRTGGLFFTHDPSEAELDLRALGYADP